MWKMKEQIGQQVYTDIVGDLTYLAECEVVYDNSFGNAFISPARSESSAGVLREERDQIIFELACKIIGKRVEPYLGIATRAVINWVTDKRLSDDFVKEFILGTKLI